MESSNRLASPQLYTVGWITALDKELAAATAVLDEEHKRPKGFKKHPRDDNNYAWGRIGDHHVVIASMAAGRYGIVSAATTAMQMVSSLPHLRFGLMVGIGAGVPRLDEGINIRLGDIVVSQPTGTSPGVVQYDLGKLKANGKSERVGSLAAPPEVLLKGLTSLKADHIRKGSRVPKILEKMFQENSGMGQDGPNGFRRPADHYDQLYETSRSVQDATNISNVTSDRDIPPACPSPPDAKERQNQPSETPKIHYGIIASGSSVVKDGIARDEILKRLDDKCICFEMEAAGLMNNFPCLVIRGICDYADEHKNDRWQNYAAATAAAFTKELLEIMDSEDIEDTSPIGEAIKECQFYKSSIHCNESINKWNF
ncbi:nacht and ankyrin domain protein [Lasiodiplodia theobromae]|uniref:Nacht and ankyrin domain protein n=1 Tax=Lasiodiplodia theobromae TaxID=45133 RepID=A0A8H7IQ98_9PEZI|nr:nacht and ankyrin domain protein [Lasiodiplodia theobromae]